MSAFVRENVSPKCQLSQGDKAQDPRCGTFPDGKSALMLVTARLKYVADSDGGL